MKRLDRRDLNECLRTLILLAPGLDNAGDEVAKPAQLIRRLRDQLVTMGNEQDALKFCDPILDDRGRHYGLAATGRRCAENALYAAVNCLIEIREKFCLIIK